MLGSWKADILVHEKSEGCEALRPKCIIAYGEVQELACLHPQHQFTPRIIKV